MNRASEAAPAPAARKPRRRIGLLGGTFDPVHVGHVALARAAFEALALDELRFVPTGRSWQKTTAAADASARVEMVRIAIGDAPGFVVDEREAHRQGDTYTVDTLVELRGELGTDPALVWLLGSDQLRNLATWHRWSELLQLAHLGVTHRAGDDLSRLDERVGKLLSELRRDTLPDAACGAIVFFPMPPVPVSASALREQLARGERPHDLLPPGVLDYIESRRLYRGAPPQR